MAYLGWYPYKQNIVAGTSDPTAYMYGDWCDVASCFACEVVNSFSEVTRVLMRGLCNYSYFDTEYFIGTAKSGYVQYIGARNTIIDFDETNQEWTMVDLTRANVRATASATGQSLLLGNFIWRIENNQKVPARGERTSPVSEQL